MVTSLHIAAYSNAALGTTANTDIPAVADQVLTISNNHFRLTDGMNLVGAAALSPLCVRARLDSPTLRIPGNPYILPVNPGASPVDRQKLLDLSANPYPLPVREEIALQATSSTGTTEVFNGFIWVQGQRQIVAPGRIQWVRLTSSTAAVANTWTQLTLTFESALPSGYWAIVGSEHQSTTAVAHRFIIPGSVYRPGFLSRLLEGNYSWPWNYNGALGELGRFVNDNPFQLQVYCTAADASHVVYVGLVPVGSL